MYSNNNNTGHMLNMEGKSCSSLCLTYFYTRVVVVDYLGKEKKKIKEGKNKKYDYKQKVSDPTHCDVKKLEKRRPNVVLFLSQLASKTGLPCREVSSRNWICPPAAEFFQ